MRHCVMLALFGAASQVVVAAPILGLGNGLGGILGAVGLGGQGGGAGAGGKSGTDKANQGGGRGGGQTNQELPSPEEVANARDGWMRDTGIVSKFMSNAEGMSSDELPSEAQKALDAELDELDQKAVLDRRFNNGDDADDVPSIRQANQVLDKQQTFQFVVDGLKRMTKNGANMSPQQVSSEVASINEERCTFVLPNIDKYMAAADKVAGSGNNAQAVRPTNCPGETGNSGNQNSGGGSKAGQGSGNENNEGQGNGNTSTGSQGSRKQSNDNSSGGNQNGSNQNGSNQRTGNQKNQNSGNENQNGNNVDGGSQNGNSQNDGTQNQSGNNSNGNGADANQKGTGRDISPENMDGPQKKQIGLTNSAIKAAAQGSGNRPNN
ncbi:hypothetical protein HIM_06442 [Hirsutella minnesotensis 3608]|uniref:Uncharacterized protein n=1 Tax=Hirsutella minnesotensis 3608 TaxID=1043627 RepID=A0A0F7ZJ86_9HYPO|nr:hypothetical protein HIM_06442 [Hirsutella minnesotensis 3608]